MKYLSTGENAHTAVGKHHKQGKEYSRTHNKDTDTWSAELQPLNSLCNVDQVHVSIKRIMHTNPTQPTCCLSLTHVLSIQRQTNRRSRLAPEPTTIEQSVSAESVGREIKTPRPPPLHLLLFPPHPCCRCFIFSARSWRRGASSAAGTRFTHRFTRSRAPPAGSPNTRRHDSPPFPTENIRLHRKMCNFRFVVSFILLMLYA